MALVNLSELIGQPQASAFLRGVVASGRYSNAYLFHGAAGVGKGTAAIAFAWSRRRRSPMRRPTTPADGVPPA